MNHSVFLTEGKIPKVLFTFSIPFLLANLLQALYGAVDLMVIGWFCGADSVAAVSTGTQVTQIITSLITGFTLSGTILVGKYAGMKEKEKVEKTISTTITFFGIFSVILMVALTVSIPEILTLLQVPEVSYQEAYEYILICCLGISFICEYNALSAILRGYGDSLSPLLFVAVACVCNIAGDLLTVRVPILYLISHAGVSELSFYGLVSPFSSLVMLGILMAYLAVLRFQRKSKYKIPFIRQEA